MVPSAAWLRSASSKIMKGQLPPSSRVTFLRPSAQSFATNLPTRVYKEWSVPGLYVPEAQLTDPVNVTFFTDGWRHRASLRGGVFSRLVVRTLKAPFRNPACSARFARANTDRGVSGEGFTTRVQPAANAAPAFLNTILKFLVILLKSRLRNSRNRKIPRH
jgi:hypothetical protein